MMIRNRIRLITVLGLFAGGASAAVVNSSWDFGVGPGDGVSWTDKDNWSNSDASIRFPNNSGDTFNVTIGAATVTLTSNSIVIDSLSLGGTLNLEAAVGVNASLNVLNPFTNTTSIHLNGNSIGSVGTAVLTVGGTGLTNEGSIQLKFGTGFTHNRTISAHLVNNSTVNVESGVDATLSKSSGQYTNNSSWVINSTATQSMSGSSQVFTQAGGTLTNNGAFDINNATFNFDGGAIGGANAIHISNGTLNIGAGSTGAGQFRLNNVNSYNGDLAATQTVTVEATSGLNANITAASGFTNFGTINLTGTSAGSVGSASLVLNSGTMTNEGLLDLQFGTGFTHNRTISANLSNNDMVNIESGVNATLSTTSGQYTNNSSWVINSTATQTMNGLGQAFTQAGGTLTNNGAFDINNATFNFNGGSIGGANAVHISNGTLNIGAGSFGAGQFRLNGANTYSGDTAAAQTVTVQATSGVNANITAASGFTNFGTINLTGTSAGSVGSASLVLNSGTMTNEGLLDLQFGTGFTHNRTITTHLLNNDMVNIESGVNATLSTTSGQYTNNSSWVINSTATQTMNGLGQAFTQAGGTLTNNGAFDINNATFNFNGGSIGGANAVHISNGTLNIGAGSFGAGQFRLNGANTYSGDTAAAQTVTVQATSGVNANITAASGFTNFGTINLTGTSAGSVGSASLVLNSGTMTNEGLLDLQFGTGFTHNRTITTHLLNNDTVHIEGGVDATLSKSSGQYDNNGSWTIDSTATLTMSGSGQVFTQAGGMLTNNGAFDISSATFNFNGGSTGGANAIHISNGTLNIGAGSFGAGQFRLNGANTYSGDTAAAQTVTVQATSGVNANLTAAAGFTNFGTVNLTGTSGGVVGSASLVLNSGTMVNEGTLDFLFGTGFSHNRILNAHLINNDLVHIEGNTLVSFTKTAGQYDNNGTIQIDAGAVLTIAGSGARNLNNNVGGVIKGGGALVLSAGVVFVNAGTLAPGSSPGILTIEGDVTQSDSASILIEIAGTTPGSQHDQLVVDGDLALDGDLIVQFLSGFTPDFLDVFTVLRTIGSGHTIGGSFDNVIAGLLQTPQGVFTVTQDSNSVELSQFIANVIPSPSSAALWLGGLALLFVRRR